jgi:hypothetical protein
MWLKRFLYALPGFFVWLFIYLFKSPSDVDITDTLVQISVGLIVTAISLIISETDDIRKRIREHKKSINNIINLLSKESLSNPATKFLVKRNSTHIKPHEFPNFYRNLLWGVDNSYKATMIASSEELEQAHNELALGIQKAKIEAENADIRRLFILRTNQEYRDIMHHMKIHEEHGIDVKFIEMKKIEQYDALYRKKESLETLDFAIADSNIMLLTFLDEEFKITSSEVVTDGGDIDIYEDFYSLLWTEARYASEDG